MIWVWTFAVLTVLLVGVAVLSGRAGQQRGGFPWFWLAFPMAVLLIAGSVNAWLPGINAVGGWTMYMPLADRTDNIQFLTNEQFWQMRAYYLGQWVLPVAALVAVGLWVWSWRRGRV